MAESRKTLIDQFNMFRQHGNYAQLRKMARRVRNDASIDVGERETILKQIKTVEPGPLVFWIGVGSVSFAAILAIVIV